jgi:hypothetical protein
MSPGMCYYVVHLQGRGSSKSHHNPKYSNHQRVTPVRASHKALHVFTEGMCAGIEILMKSFILWKITPCSPLQENRRFGRTYRLHLQGRGIRKAINQHQAGRKICLSRDCSTLKMEEHILQKNQLTSNGLHGLTS